jgi:extradiol dioxygenase
MKITALGYLGFESTNAKAWETFGPEIFGLALGEPGADGTTNLRMDDRHHRIAIRPGTTDRLAYIGWEVQTSDAFAVAVEELRAAGLNPQVGSAEERRQRGVQAFVSVRDPADYIHEVFFGPKFTPGSFRPGKAMQGFVAGTEGVGHVVVVVPELTKELDDFVTKIMGFKPFAGAPSDMVEHGGPNARFYRCNRRTHSFAYVGIPSMHGVQHICIEANSIDDVGTAYDTVQQRQLPVTLSLGRHQMDTLVSFYMRTPSGFDIEFGAGGLRLGDDFVQQDPAHSELWGHKPVLKGWAPTVQNVGV